jgi:hypothetical protein
MPEDYQPEAESGRAWEAWFESLGSSRMPRSGCRGACPAMADRAIAARGLVKRFGPVVTLDGIDLAVEGGSVLRCRRAA